MPIVTAQQVVDFTDISITEAQITARGLIPIVQDRINRYCFNWFVSEDIYLRDSMTFTAATGKIVASNSWVTPGFAAGDEIYLAGSYRNDGYYTINSVTTVTLTIASSASVVSEISGATILVSLVQWPVSLCYTVAQMVKYDADDRKTRSGGLASQSLGPRSESYTNVGGAGYPSDIIDGLDAFHQVRLM